MSATLTFADKEGPLGTITMQAGQLTASSRGLQSMADSALRNYGSAEEAWKQLATYNNGYVWALR